MDSFIVMVALALFAAPVLVVVALAQIAGLKARISRLERLSTAAVGDVHATPAPRAPSVLEAPPPDAPASDRPSGPAAPAAATGARDRAAPTVHAARPPRPPDVFDTAMRLLRHWFTRGNVPVKVGMLVLFAGVAALLKHASDQGWLAAPPELRLAAVAAAAVVGLHLGWRQRDRRRVFALSLQGGAIGILMMTVFAAYREFGVVSAGAAFATSIVLVAGCGTLAVLQNARALAVLAILAGFLSPVLLSTGTGSHVALFSYYAVLNLAIATIAWYRPWRALNLVGFVCTFGIAGAWGVLAYRPEHIASTLPFLALFFVLYLLLPLLHARRRGARRRDLVDGCLVFGNPLISFALLAALLEGRTMPTAFAALGLAVLYLLLAQRLWRRERYHPIAEAWVLLGAGFATLAVPLALSARATAAVFALEGAALVWLGLRTQRRTPLWSGVTLQVLAAGSLLWVGFAQPDALLIANPAFIGALLVSAAGFASAWGARRWARPRLAPWFYAWGLLWWVLAGIGEIARHFEPTAQPPAWLVFVAVTLAGLGIAMRRSRFDPLSWSTVLAFAAGIAIAVSADGTLPHAFHGAMAWAWLAYAATGLWALAGLLNRDGPPMVWALGLWLATWNWALASALEHVAIAAGLGTGWRGAAVALPWLLTLGALVHIPQWIGIPLQSRRADWRAPIALAFGCAVLLAWSGLLLASGDVRPLNWWPVLNPVELATLLSLAVLAGAMGTDIAPRWLAGRRLPVLSLLAFLSLSAFALRSVHQYTDLAWRSGLLATPEAQSSLTLVWSTLGVGAWIAGSRRRITTVWLAGAVLMGLVLAKLLLVDRQHLGNLAGIASFIGYGVLCTVVGYFAPAPPRNAEPAGNRSENP